MLEKVFEYLKNEGLVPERVDNRIRFKYQMFYFVIFGETDDERFLNITLPEIYEVNADNRIDALEAINTVNDGTKLVKLYIYDNEVWVGVEQLLDSTPDLGDIIPRTLRVLIDGRERFYKALKEL